VARNNNELVATWGNLANRVLSFSYRHWDGSVPDVDPSQLREADLNLLKLIDGGFETVGAELEAVHLRAALADAMRLASAVNQYLDQTAPWSAVKTDKAAAALSIYTALRAIDSLKILFAPFLPFSSERLHSFLGYDTPLFGEQYLEDEQDDLGTHTVLRYRGGQHCGSLAS
jgi:methionyl-tRNA synthetase